MATENEILLKFAKALEQIADKEDGDHLKTPAAFSTYTPLHGSGGIFSTPGIERDIVTAHVRPYGINDRLPLLPSIDQDPRFGALTGYTAEVGSQPDNACDDAPIRYVKACNLTARFGRVRYDTNTIDIDDVMLRINRGDFTDLLLRGRVLGLTNAGPSGMNENEILDVVTMSEMVGVAVAFEREFTRQIWQGSFGVANQFPGLDTQIATGHVDADTNVACPAVDSDVKNYNYTMLANSIVTYLSQLEAYLKHNAMTMGLDPVQWVIAMRPELWFELTAIWPCAYHTVKCAPTVDTNSQVYIDGRENTTERDAMRNGLYLDINGSRYPVVLDTGIFEHNNVNNGNLGLGQYASTIYMVPLTITGGFPVTYREYVDYRQAARDKALLRGMEDFFWSDNGVYSWAIENAKWCYKLAAKSEQRVILRTPQLAGRIDAVGYEPLQHLRDPHPSDPYFLDGGASIRPGLGAPNSVWN
jgi:hypothetical protein